MVCHAALGIYMLAVNRSRDGARREYEEVFDEEAEKRKAEAGGMLDQTEVSLPMSI